MALVCVLLRPTLAPVCVCIWHTCAETDCVTMTPRCVPRRFRYPTPVVPLLLALA